MTVGERLVDKLRKTGQALCDDCLAEVCELTVRQHANRQARVQQERGELQRWKGSCDRCGGEKLVNVSRP